MHRPEPVGITPIWDRLVLDIPIPDIPTPEPQGVYVLMPEPQEPDIPMPIPGIPIPQAPVISLTRWRSTA